MAQQTFKNSVKTSLSQGSNGNSGGSLELVASRTEGAPSAELLANAVLAAARNSLNASKLLRQYARSAGSVHATLANLFRANAAFRTRSALKTVAAALYSAHDMEPAAAEKFLIRLGLQLVSVESEAAIEPAFARRLLQMAGVKGNGSARDLAARALLVDAAYQAEFQSQIVNTAVQAGQLVGASTGNLSVRARVGYAGPRHKRGDNRRSRAAVRAAERALLATATN